jgi:transposase
MQRIIMRKIKEILRLKLDLKRSNREIAASIGISSSTVSECIRRARNANIPWPPPDDFNDEKLEQVLYFAPPIKLSLNNVDWAYVNSELKRKGVTLQLLWKEQKVQCLHDLSYSRYCARYRDWQLLLETCMRQNYKAGEKMFVDYSGLTIPIVININTAETEPAEIFVAALGASNYTYVEATMSQALPDWISSHVRAFEFFGGVTEILIPDNLKSGINKADRYEPEANATYSDMAMHYQTAIIPARVYTPTDKAKVEEAVQNVERSILAKLRNRTFFSIYELNDAIKPLLAELNQRPFQKLPGSRCSLFETLEKPVLKPLPETRYIFAEWKKARTGIDYHIALNKHYYSVPYTLIKKELDVRFTVNIVEIFYKEKRVASHIRSNKQGAFTTVLEHMPRAHQEYVKWTPERLINWAHQTGTATAELAEKIVESRQHPQQGFRACLGIMRLENKWGKERLENACQRALTIGAYSYKSVVSILNKNLDKQPITEELQKHATEQKHEFVRGNNYFQ